MPAGNREGADAVAAAPGDDDGGLALVVLDDAGRPRAVPVLDHDGVFAARVRQRADGQTELAVTLTLGGVPLGRVALPREPWRLRGDAVVVELERSARRVVLRMWPEGDLGLVERTFLLPPPG